MCFFVGSGAGLRSSAPREQSDADPGLPRASGGALQSNADEAMQEVQNPVPANQLPPPPAEIDFNLPQQQQQALQQNPAAMLGLNQNPFLQPPAGNQPFGGGGHRLGSTLEDATASQLDIVDHAAAKTEGKKS